MNCGRVYIASKKFRGPWAPKPQGCIVLDVTSAQRKDNITRRDFSPMTPVYGGYKGYYCFENYWQSGKVYNSIDRNAYITWWRQQSKGKRRKPGTKNLQVLYAQWEHTPPLDYIASRKYVYVPEYFNLMINSEAYAKYAKLVANGQDVVVYDFDGPKDDNGECIALPITLDLLRRKLLDTRHPFGHGYIVAAALAGYGPQSYCR